MQNNNKKYSSEEKIRIVIDGLRKESRITELYRREGISSNIDYNGSFDYLEEDKKRFNTDLKPETTTNEVYNLKNENVDLSQFVTEFSQEVGMQEENITDTDYDSNI